MLCVAARLRHSLCLCLSLPRLEAASGSLWALMDGAGASAVQRHTTVFQMSWPCCPVLIKRERERVQYWLITNTIAPETWPAFLKEYRKEGRVMTSSWHYSNFTTASIKVQIYRGIPNLPISATTWPPPIRKQYGESWLTLKMNSRSLECFLVQRANKPGTVSADTDTC